MLGSADPSSAPIVARSGSARRGPSRETEERPVRRRSEPAQPRRRRRHPLKDEIGIRPRGALRRRRRQEPAPEVAMRWPPRGATRLDGQAPATSGPPCKARHGTVTSRPALPFDPKVGPRRRSAAVHRPKQVAAQRRRRTFSARMEERVPAAPPASVRVSVFPGGVGTEAGRGSAVPPSPGSAWPIHQRRQGVSIRAPIRIGLRRVQTRHKGTPDSGELTPSHCGAQHARLGAQSSSEDVPRERSARRLEFPFPWPGNGNRRKERRPRAPRLLRPHRQPHCCRRGCRTAVRMLHSVLRAR